MKLEHVTQHIYLVLMAALFTIVFGLIFGIIAYLFPKVRKYVIFVFDLFQTLCLNTPIEARNNAAHPL